MARRERQTFFEALATGLGDARQAPGQMQKFFGGGEFHLAHPSFIFQGAVHGCRIIRLAGWLFGHRAESTFIRPLGVLPT